VQTIQKGRKVVASEKDLPAVAVSYLLHETRGRAEHIYQLRIA
jgi:hypothetical protein